MDNEPKRYVYNKQAGALQEAAAAPPGVRTRLAMRPSSSIAQSLLPSQLDDQAAANAAPEPLQRDSSRLPRPPRPADSGRDPIRPTRRPGMFSFTIEDGEHVLMIHKNGAMEELVGPKRVSTLGRTFRRMDHYVAHPGEFLVVRYRDGRQEHLVGPAHLWLDPRKHLSVTREEGLQLAAKEAVVIYARGDAGEVTRRVLQGPAVFVAQPGEWLHSFSWHGSSGTGYRKVPNALVFEKLWLMPDQMYHDVEDVRTADDAVITVRLMIFFELVDIELMLATSHDPIGDFVNAATSDVVDFLGRHDLASFKLHTDQLGDLATYRQLTARAGQCGYRIGKVVYRGFDAPPSLQQMLDQAIESRTRLQLERATQQQAQELEDFKLERQLGRGERQRADGAAEQAHALALEKSRRAAAIEADAARSEFQRAQRRLDQERALADERARHDEESRHLAALHGLGVDLTALLTQHRADQVIELRGDGEGAHVHVDAPRREPR
ncbi:hypothetical protein [Nannocystis bainbridge]|uniref:Band 7 domain-containing protein n=1 Tax=Nannocystis bainbridge TaxID=2995303 RepID=A0ABT5E642_9BACT|nr:hypothetical protein [Nannocystis bainbridge]MDC0720272.1 hypothetical protein [Nannocystis bainbridge]